MSAVWVHSPPRPLDYCLSSGQVLAVRPSGDGAWFIAVGGQNIARVESMATARHIFFALASADTVEAVVR